MGEGDEVAAELAPVGGGAVALLAPMDVEGTDEGGALTAVVIEGQELEASVARGAEVTLYLIFVGEHLQPSAGHQKLLGLPGHAVSCQQVAEDLEVGSLVNTGVLRDFLEVGEGTPLSLLVADEDSRRSHAFSIL